MHDYPDDPLQSAGNPDPFEVLQSTPLRLEVVFERLTPDDYDLVGGSNLRTIRELLAGLADFETVSAFRFRQILAEDNAGLQPFSLASWSERYDRADPALAVAAFRALRSWNLSLISSLDLDDWLREGYHPQLGVVSIDDLVRRLAANDLARLEELEATLQGA